MLNVAVLCSKRAPGLPELREHVNVSCVLERQLPHGRDREAFDAMTATLLFPYDVDAVVLLGYLHVLTAPMLDAFPGRIVNVHDSDLTLRCCLNYIPTHLPGSAKKESARSPMAWA